MTTERTKLRQGIVIIAVAALFLFGSVSAVQAKESQPNILFIFADDWGWGDLS